MKKIVMAEILRNQSLGDRIFDMVLKAPEIASQACAGQFVSVYTDDPSKILPRPISLCEVDREQGTLRLVYRVTGEKTGTMEFSKANAGDVLKIMGPLGNGFPSLKEKNVWIIGGGIGVFPLFELTKQVIERDCPVKVSALLGYRNANRFLIDEFEALAKDSLDYTVYTATEDGSFGFCGNVMNIINSITSEGSDELPDVIYACGPKPMLRAIQAFAKQENIECYLSLEERMACGIGACLACVCETEEEDGHSHVRNARICKDGPVFEAKAIVL